MRGTMMDFQLTIQPILERAGKLFPAVEIVSRRPDRSLKPTTYGEIYRRSRRLARALELAGMARGDRVATLMWNHSVHLEAYLGVPVSGGVLHTLNLRLHPDELAYIANHARDRYLIVDDVLLPVYESFRTKTNFERVFVVPFSGGRFRVHTKTTKIFFPLRTMNLSIRYWKKMKRRLCVLPPALRGKPKV